MMETTMIDLIKQERNRKYTCCICHNVYRGYGNNPQPLIMKAGSRCCDDCNWFVIQERKKINYFRQLMEQSAQM